MALLARANDESRKNSLKKENEMRRSMKKGRHSTKKIKANRSGMAADPDTSANDTGILRDLDRLAKSPVSPGPNRLLRTKSSGEVKLKRIEDASMTNKIFDFTNQMNDLKASALDHRSSNSRRGSRISLNSSKTSGLNTSA